MDEERAAFEQLTLANFKMWNPTTLKTFNNFSLIMTNISDSILIFELIQQAVLMSFILFLNILKVPKTSL